MLKTFSHSGLSDCLRNHSFHGTRNPDTRKALNIAYEHSPSLIQSKLSLEQRQLNLKAQNASLKSQFSLDVNPFLATTGAINTTATTANGTTAKPCRHQLL